MLWLNFTVCYEAYLERGVNLTIAELRVGFMLELKDLQVFTVVHVAFQLAEEIPCISAVVVSLLSEVIFV